MGDVAPTSLDDLEEGVASGSFPLHLDRENTKEEHLNRGARSVPGDRWDKGVQVGGDGHGQEDFTKNHYNPHECRRSRSK